MPDAESKVYKAPTGEETLTEYSAAIPADLHNLLIPSGASDRIALSGAIRKLAVVEEERNYVLELQHQYGIPIRPNESVKRTMIRVRLKMLRKLRAAGVDEDLVEPGSLPVDPLE